MAKSGLFGLWFCLLVVCFLVWPGLARVLKPAECLASGTYDLIRQPDAYTWRCWRDCFTKPGCHIAVVVKPLSGSDECLLVNCWKKGKHSYHRDPSAQIRVYPKRTADEDQRRYLVKGTYGLADETLRCIDAMDNSSCRSGVPRFFYNQTSFRCERFYSGCGSSRNTFETQEGCEALCNEKFRCYRPMEYGAHSGHFPKFFYNISSQRCEGFDFSGRGSNGNIFSTVEECESLCGDVKAATTSQPAVNSDTTAAVPTEMTVILAFIILVIFLVIFPVVALVKCRKLLQRSSSIGDKEPILQDPDE